MDCARAIADAEGALQKAQLERERRGREKEALCDFQRRISELPAWFDKEQYKYWIKVFYLP